MSRNKEPAEQERQAGREKKAFRKLKIKGGGATG
jgi:hypothetical protein